MRIVLIGAGHLATRLGIALMESGNEILQVYSRTMLSADTLATRLNAVPVIHPEAVCSDADLYVCALKDRVLSDVLPNVAFGNGILVHTAGSLPMDVLAPYAPQIGVFYPFQTFSKLREVDFSQVPIYIEASDDAVKKCLLDLAGTLSQNVFEANAEKRLSLHVAAVFACNFTNYMYTLAYDILKEKDMRFDALLPLIRETARKVETLIPAEAQTGPAVRLDSNVMEKHLHFLLDQPERTALYETLSKAIYERQTNK